MPLYFIKNTFLDKAISEGQLQPRMDKGHNENMSDPELATEEQLDYSFLTHPVVIVVTVVRFLAAAIILVNPLWGLILSMIFDLLDGQALTFGAKVTREQYHLWDKNVDWFAYVAELWIGSQYGAFLPLFILLFWRFMGTFMFDKSKKTIYFVIFPNFFEAAFIWLIVFHPLGTKLSFNASQPWLWLGILFVVKELQEFSLHFVWTKLHLPHIEDQIKWIAWRLSTNKHGH